MAGIVFPGSGEKVLASGGSMTVHFLDVGQGLSILVQSEGQNLLYDGGPRSASSYVVSYLQEQNVSEIDYLISSHYDEDHVSGLIGCLNAFQVDNVIGADYIHDSSLYGSFMDAVAAHGLEVQHPAVGAEYTFGLSLIHIWSRRRGRRCASGRNLCSSNWRKDCRVCADLCSRSTDLHGWRPGCFCY